MYHSFILFCLISLSLVTRSHAAIPTVDFTGTLRQFVGTSASWCTTCTAFSTTCGQTVMGCAGDNGGGGACPADACPRVFTFTSQNNIPIWNINVATSGNPYRAFSYIPICTNAASCTEPFVFSFSVKYTPKANAAMPVFGNQFDYLKLLFWGDGNNILGVKNGQLLGFPNGGSADLVGSTTTGNNNAFSTPFPINTWTNIAVKFTYANARATLAFFVNGQAIGSTTSSIGTQNSGLQFGAYTWGGTMYTIQYTNIQFTAANVIPNPTVGGATAPATAAPTQAPTTAVPTTAVPTTAAPTTAATTRPPTTAATTKPPTAGPTNGQVTTAPTNPQGPTSPTSAPTEAQDPTIPSGATDAPTPFPSPSPSISSSTGGLRNSAHGVTASYMMIVSVVTMVWMMAH